jgi:WD40 repeat protein
VQKLRSTTLVSGSSSSSSSSRKKMRSLVQWEDPGLPEKDGVKSTVYELDFSRDGNLLVVACKNFVLVYDIKEGDLLHRLKGHKGEEISEKGVIIHSLPCARGEGAEGRERAARRGGVCVGGGVAV